MTEGAPNGRGDEPGYYLSLDFWTDRYRDLAIGDFTSRETIRARLLKQIAEQERRRSESGE